MLPSRVSATIHCTVIYYSDLPVIILHFTVFFKYQVENTDTEMSKIALSFSKVALSQRVAKRYGGLSHCDNAILDDDCAKMKFCINYYFNWIFLKITL